MAERDTSKLYLFDVDGTLTASRKVILFIHRGLLESYSDSAHLATYGGQTSVVAYLFLKGLHKSFIRMIVLNKIGQINKKQSI